MLILIFNFVSAIPARCKSDNDCLKGKAKCVRRECHCIDKYGYGDGKAKCDSKYEVFCREFLSPIPQRNRLFCSISWGLGKDTLLSHCVSLPRCKNMGTSEFNAMRNTVSDGLASNPEEVGIIYKYWSKLILGHWKIWPIYRLYEMSVDPELTDLVLFKNRMSVNLLYKHFV